MKTPLTLMLLLMMGCGGEPPSGPPSTLVPTILSVEGATPLLQGTSLEVMAADLDAAGLDVRLRVEVGDQRYELRRFASEQGLLRFPISAELATAASSPLEAELVLVGSLAQSEPFPFTLEVAQALPIELGDVPDGLVHWNDRIVVSGAGFLEPTEGEVVALVDGTFALGDVEVPVSVGLPAEQAELGSRDRGLVLLSTRIGSIQPGRFDGMLRLRSQLASGQVSESEPVSVSFQFQTPVVFQVTPERGSMEEILSIRGAGFVGGENNEVTVIRIEGMFTPPMESAYPFGPVEEIFPFRSGSELGWELSAEVSTTGESLEFSLFGAPSGHFEGTLTPIAIQEDAEVEGTGAPVSVTLGAPRQVVLVRFLPGFYDSLTHFGLAAGAGVVEELVRERIESIYERWGVDVRLEAPDNITDSGLAIIEIGGPDPNGRGLFGYDNTPGKDVGNLRLRDAIGGANAETQDDGYPGYGGVFVESFLAFSTHPDIDVGAGPPTDPLFDDIFDSVRASPATLDEVRGSAARASEVGRALRALASMIGETSAHELGHSLGMADPFGSPTVFHNTGDGEGCLMDAGSNRPLGERAAQPGYPATRLCADNELYLDEILAPR